MYPRLRFLGENKGRVMMMAKEGRVGKAAVADWPGLLHRLCPPDFWQRWDNGNPATAMSHLGGGIYYYKQVVDPGDHWYKEDFAPGSAPVALSV